MLPPISLEFYGQILCFASLNKTNLNLLQPFIYSEPHQILLAHRYQPLKSFFPEKSGSTPKVFGVISAPISTLPSVIEISSVVFG